MTLADEIKREVDELKFARLLAELEKCSPAQVALFHRIYPKGPSEAQFYNAIDQIERTLKKNLSKKKEVEDE